MEGWAAGIKEFDEDLKKRMIVIKVHEVTGINFDSSIFVLRILGFSIKGEFPSWRDNTKEWRNRNRERVNTAARKQQKNWYLKNHEKAKERARNYYKRNRVKKLEYQKLWISKNRDHNLELRRKSYRLRNRLKTESPGCFRMRDREMVNA